MGDKVKDLDGGTIEAPRWPKDNPFLKKRLSPIQLDLLQNANDPIYQISEKIYASIVDKRDEAVVQAIIEYAKEQGITDLILIDEKSIREALEKQAPRRVEERDGRCTTCPRCEKYCGGLRAPHCINCGQALSWEANE